MFESTEKTCNVKPFSSDLGMTWSTPIVDVALAHEFPCVDEIYVLVLRNVLHVPSMENKLILSFILRLDDITINDVPNMYYEYPKIYDHSISFEYSKLRMHLQLNGVLS